MEYFFNAFNYRLNEVFEYYNVINIHVGVYEIIGTTHIIMHVKSLTTRSRTVFTMRRFFFLLLTCVSLLSLLVMKKKQQRFAFSFLIVFAFI